MYAAIPAIRLLRHFGRELDEKAIALREVKVRPQKIRNSGDTLTYSVVAFRHGQELSIADVIAKMPGLEVQPNGAIKYQGKNINKV